MEHPQQPAPSVATPDAMFDATLGRAAPPSRPVGGEVLYRPGARWAALALVVPVLVASVGAALAYRGTPRVLTVIAAALALWLLVIPLFWLNLKRVRLMPEGIEVARPWRRGFGLTWGEIERISTSRGMLILHGQKGKLLTFHPFLLRDGGQLRRRLLLRVPSQVLVGPLRQEAQRLTTGPVYRATTGDLAGALETCAAWPWRAGVLLACLACAVLALLAVTLAPAPVGKAFAVGLAAVGLGALWLYVWLSRPLILAESGVVLGSVLPGRAHACGWEAFRLVEVTPGEMLLRLRGEVSLVCAGPRLLSSRDRELANLFIREYCERRGVARVVRRRFW